MATTAEIGTLLLACPDQLPAATIAHLVAHCAESGELTLPLLRRSEVTAEQALTIFSRDRHLTVHKYVAWLARPERPLADMPALILGVHEQSRQLYRRADPTELITCLLAEPLCRPDMAAVLAGCDLPSLTAGVAASPAAPPAVRETAVLHTDALLSPDPARPAKRINPQIAKSIALYMGTLTNSATVARWCELLHTPALLLQAAAAADTLTPAQAGRVLHAGVLPAVTSRLTAPLEEHLRLFVARHLRHLAAADRNLLLNALTTGPNATSFLVPAVRYFTLPDPAALSVRTLTGEANVPAAVREDAARQVITLLGEDPARWDVLLRTAPALGEDATLTDLLTLVVGITETATTTA